MTTSITTAAALLTVASAFDNRNVTEEAAALWAEALATTTLDDGRAAIVAHYSQRRDWIMPADINREVATIRRRRLKSVDIPDPPPGLSHGQTVAWHNRMIRLVGDGMALDAALNQATIERD